MTEEWGDGSEDGYSFQTRRDFFRWLGGFTLSLMVGIGLIALIGSTAIRCMGG